MTTELTAVIERVKAFSEALPKMNLSFALLTAYGTNAPDKPLRDLTLAADLQALLSTVGEGERLASIIERDRSTVASGVTAIRRAMASREHLREPGRGCFAYDDEGYQKEFGAALDEIEVALAPLLKVAKDWSDCPTDPAKIAAARSAVGEGCSSSQDRQLTTVGHGDPCPMPPDRLLPCPLCRGEAHFCENRVDFVQVWGVTCEECGLWLDCCMETEPEAAALWNTRAPSLDREKAAEVIDRLKITRDLYAKILSTRVKDDQPNVVKMPSGKRLKGEGADLMFALLDVLETSSGILDEAIEALSDGASCASTSDQISSPGMNPTLPPNTTGEK